jgi:HAD superfamily hydrolase (TIGR01549 family)
LPYPQPAPSSRLRALLFDLGSTLIYFQGEPSAVFRRSLAALHENLRAAGVMLDRDAFLRDFQSRLEAYYSERETEFIEYTTAYLLKTTLAEYGHPDLPETTLRLTLAAMYAITQDYWQADPDATSTLETLRRQGYRLGLVSNAADDADVQALVDKAALRSYFDIILTSAAAGIRKPNPRIFQLALEPLDTPSSEAAMIGDKLGADILGAQNAGIFAIWVTRYANTPANHDHLDTIQPDAIIPTIKELPALLENLPQPRGASL